MIVFVHMPKTAGQSLHAALEDAYPQRCLVDSSDLPLSDFWRHRKKRLLSRLKVRLKCRALAERYDLVFGHFIASKYACLPGKNQVCAFFRDPVDRVCSHYFFWKRVVKYDNSLRCKLYARNMDLVAFANEPKMRRLYEMFLGGCAVEDLAFVGLTEQYDRSLELYGKIFGRPLGHKKVNVGTIAAYKEKLEQEGTLEAVTRSQDANQRIYAAAQARFENLCATYGV